SRCWAAPLAVPAGASGETFDFRIWKTAHLRGRVGVVSGETLPQQVSVTFQLPGSAHNERTEVACPVARASRSWTCSMPAAKLDLRVAASGFAPHYLWDVDLSAAQTMEVGELQLARGASITGWVSSEDPSVELRETAVKLVPLTFAAHAPGATVRDALRVDQTKPNARGFFQFGNVPPGLYYVTAEKAGLSRAVRDDIKIGEANELLLEVPLTLRRMATVDALISPPLDPFGAPWQISLRKRTPQTSAFSKEVASGPATMSGGWRSDDLEAGPYLLRVSDSRGALYEYEQIDVASDAPLVNIVVRAVAVEGTLRIGGTPARAELRFRPMRGNGSTVLTSGDDGTFSGVLAREGKWRVEVALPSGQTREVTELEVRRRAAEERARVDVKLPEGRIAGKIVDAQGQPISGAVLVFRNGEPYADVKTDAPGEFELLGMDEGTFEVQGTTRDGASAALPVTIDEGPPQRLTLVVAKRRQLAGRVVSASGAPLAGAVIRYVLDRSGFVGETVSSPTGRFTLEYPAASRLADLLILTPGLPAKLVAISLAEQRGTIEIRVGDAGGQLLLQVQPPPPWPFIFRGNAAFAVPLFRRPDGANGRNAWHHEHGIALVVEPGQYLVCPTYAPTAQCISTEVPAGGTALVNTTSWAGRQDIVQTEER
ncbi:MAG TPA: carboxypeptidase-like regulatory domain-containing protein, partial [Thermoanaerobaculia bacterium]|nr:carboxypeptidase-like regulatory domain-containing protein [Thermoanaerobaculia bacterium]